MGDRPLGVCLLLWAAVPCFKGQLWFWSAHGSAPASSGGGRAAACFSLGWRWFRPVFTSGEVGSVQLLWGIAGAASLCLGVRFRVSIWSAPRRDALAVLHPIVLECNNSCLVTSCRSLLLEGILSRRLFRHISAWFPTSGDIFQMLIFSRVFHPFRKIQLEAGSRLWSCPIRVWQSWFFPHFGGGLSGTGGFSLEVGHRFNLTDISTVLSVVIVRPRALGVTQGLLVLLFPPFRRGGHFSFPGMVGSSLLSWLDSGGCLLALSVGVFWASIWVLMQTSKLVAFRTVFLLALSTRGLGRASFWLSGHGHSLVFRVSGVILYTSILSGQESDSWLWFFAFGYQALVAYNRPGSSWQVLVPCSDTRAFPGGNETCWRIRSLGFTDCWLRGGFSGHHFLFLSFRLASTFSLFCYLHRGSVFMTFVICILMVIVGLPFWV